jgi:Secretion system C-terminal sorting domain
MRCSFVETDGSFAFDPFQLKYYADQFPHDEFRIYAKKPSEFTVSGKEYRTLSGWIAQSPLTLILNGARVLIDTVGVIPDTVLIKRVTVLDQNGNTLSVGNTTNQTNADFYIEKKRPNGQIVWTRTYSSVGNHCDSAKCVSVDNENSVYVAGKIWHNGHYNIHVLKYDSTGYLLWEKMNVDTINQVNDPNGIEYSAQNGNVIVTGTVDSQNSTLFRTFELTQCTVASQSNRELQNTVSVTADNLWYSPNPTTGLINLNLSAESKGQFSLYNIEGKQMYSSNVIGSTIIDLGEENLTNGIYLIKYVGEDGITKTGKLVINNSN